MRDEERTLVEVKEQLESGKPGVIEAAVEMRRFYNEDNRAGVERLIEAYREEIRQDSELKVDGELAEEAVEMEVDTNLHVAAKLADIAGSRGYFDEDFLTEAPDYEGGQVTRFYEEIADSVYAEEER